MSLSIENNAKLKAVLEAHAAPEHIYIGSNNFVAPKPYKVVALIVQEHSGSAIGRTHRTDWFSLACICEIDGKRVTKPFVQVRERNGKVMARSHRWGRGWKTARALEKMRSDYGPILTKVQRAFDAEVMQ